MDYSADPRDRDLDGLEQLSATDWPDWHLWRSRRGELVCATRRYGTGYTLIANDPGQLLSQLQREPKRVRL